MTKQDELWLCITDYADTYGVNRSTVYKWLDAGLLEVYRVERVIRIRNKPPNTHAPNSTNAGAC